MGDELVEAGAVEMADGDLPIPGSQGTVRPLPVAAPSAEIESWHEDARTLAVAAVGGVAIGVATVAAVNALLAARGARRGLSRAARRRRGDRGKIVASRSFLVDIHVLGR